MRELIGMEVKDTEGRVYVVKDKVGEGAQGAVYNTENEAFLIKFIHVDDDKKNYMIKHFKWIMKQRVPKEARIIIPIAILQEPFVGYIMKKAKGHESLNKYLTPPKDSSIGEWYNIQTGGLRKRLEIAASLSKCYRQLHLQGLCYCDVSPNNILVAKQQKSIVLIDSDNLTSTDSFSPSVLGTPRYIAPELFSLAEQPNSISDTYSFAVILFELLRLGHPLLGDAILDGPPEDEAEALKGNTVYVDHPVDDSNRNTMIFPAEFILTEELKDLFDRMFVDGLHNYMKRPTLYEFTSALQKAEDQLIKCDNSECQAYYFAQKGHEQICPWCDEKKNEFLSMQFVETTNLIGDFFENGKIKLGKITASLILNEDVKAIYRGYMEPSISQDLDKIIASVKKIDNKQVVMENCSNKDFWIINKNTRDKGIFKSGEQRIVKVETENIVVDYNRNIDDISAIFGENNRINAIIFTIN